MKYFYKYLFGMLSFVILMGCASNTVKKELDNDKEKFVYVQYEPSRTYGVSTDLAHAYDNVIPKEESIVEKRKKALAE